MADPPRETGETRRGHGERPLSGYRYKKQKIKVKLNGLDIKGREGDFKDLVCPLFPAREGKKKENWRNSWR
jgi:hypothetical protein